jgi:hypothetical protein
MRVMSEKSQKTVNREALICTKQNAIQILDK